MEEWASLRWFEVSTLRDFVWDRFFYLYLILLIPLLFVLRWAFMVKFRQKLPMALPAQRLRWSPVSLLRFVPDLVLSLSLVLLLVALARPQKTQQRVELYSEGIDIILVLDVSQSMLAEDFKPNRLESAKRVAREFIKGRFQDRIGIIVFSGDAYAMTPLTTDYYLLNSMIDDIQYGMIRTPGTAIGSALAVTVNRMRESTSKSKVAILISDGDNTAGNLDPVTAAGLAKVYNIKLYTILVGMEGLVPVRLERKGKIQYENNTIDETTLRKIAEIGEGRFYRASNGQALKAVFTNINGYEKAEIKETRYKDTEDYYRIYLRWAIVFLVLWMLLKATFISNVFED
jgi:Ca-activated chloride channel family protein